MLPPIADTGCDRGHGDDFGCHGGGRSSGFGGYGSCVAAAGVCAGGRLGRPVSGLGAPACGRWAPAGGAAVDGVAGEGWIVGVVAGGVRLCGQRCAGQESSEIAGAVSMST
ncbi:hypothetical protein Mkiyose1088_38830 [Mycobacterium kiyosense]|nr:hypothetical protein Mkiyose1088_38830 [Mycobacterium kiyosense]